MKDSIWKHFELPWVSKEYLPRIIDFFFFLKNPLISIKLGRWKELERDASKMVYIAPMKVSEKWVTRPGTHSGSCDYIHESTDRWCSVCVVLKKLVCERALCVFVCVRARRGKTKHLWTSTHTAALIIIRSHTIHGWPRPFMSTQNGVWLRMHCVPVKVFQTTAADGLILRLVIHPTFPHARQQRFALERERPGRGTARSRVARTKTQDHARARLFSRDITFPSRSRVFLCFARLMEKLHSKIISWD